MVTNIPPQELVEYAAALKELEEYIEESLTTMRGRNLIDLQEPGWQQLGAMQRADQIAAEIDRQTQNLTARWYYHQDPTASQAVMLHNAYIFARGVSVKAKDQRLQDWITHFWRDQRNRHSLTRAQAQWHLNTERQLEGELFFGFYVSTLTGRVTVRVFDPSEFPEANGIITMPGDPTFPIYFRREYAPRWFDFDSGTYKTARRRAEYLPDFRNAASGAPDRGGHGRWVQWPAQTEIYVMRMCTNSLGGRGLTHLNAGLAWVKALKGFMEDRATLTLALATFAFKQKVKGNRQAVQRLIDQWSQYETDYRYGVGDGRERRQGANTIIENEATSLEQLRVDSGASQAYQDMRMFRQQAGLGLGHIFEHYLGDPSTGNLATATAMELPMLKLFEFEQQVWEDVIGDILWFVTMQGLRFGPRDLKALANVGVEFSGGSPLWQIEPLSDFDLAVEATLPPIVQGDIAIRAAALASIAQAETMTGQQIIPPDRKATIALTDFGFDDVGQIVDQMRADGFKIDLPKTAATQPVAAAMRNLRQAIIELKQAKQLQEAEAKDTPPDIGKPLPKDDAEQVERVTKSEVEQAFDDFEAMPELENLLAEMGLTLDDVDE